MMAMLAAILVLGFFTQTPLLLPVVARSVRLGIVGLFPPFFSPFALRVFF